MKIKILFVPFAIVLVIIMIIWWIYPAYTNGVDGLREKLAELQEKKGKLSDLSGKSLNVDALSGELASITVDSQVLYEFVPNEIKEEEIVDDISFFSSKSGVAISEINISQPLADSAIAVSDAPPSLLPQPQSIETKIKILGTYENIKEFFNNISKLKRYNNFARLYLDKSVVSSESQIPSNVLSAEIGINFNILKEAKLSDGNISDPVFSKNSLDKEILTEIKNKKNANTFKLDIDQKGKTNPFIP